ncbi:MAG: hypothetical protein H0U49_00825 [Parachlamydiaceae bacterium]|nr:hypothetical protein [Parachlamydiaceae bacterium]
MNFIKKMKSIYFVFMQLVLIPFPFLMAQWQPPVFISQAGEDIQFVGGVTLDVNSSNNGVTVWGAPSGLHADIKASSYIFGSGWTNPVIISSTALNQFGKPIYVVQGDPQVSLNEANYAVAVWEGSEFLEDIEENIQGVFSSTSTTPGIWSPVQRISARNLGTDFFPANPSADVNDAGLALVAWVEERSDVGDDIKFYIMTSFLELGGTWTTPFQISAPFLDSDKEFTPDVAINSRGDAVVVWKNRVQPFYTVTAATYNAATATWSPPITLDPGLNENLTFHDLPKAGIDENGNAVAVWNWQNDTIYKVFASSFTPGLGWSPATILQQTTNLLGDANVVMDRFGNSTAIWDFFDIPTLSNQVYSSSLPLGGTWSSPVIISTNSGDNFLSVSLVQVPISVDLDGNVIVTYINDGDTVRSVSRLVNGGWQNSEIVTRAIRPGLLNIGLGSCGFAIDVWQADDLSGTYRVEGAVRFGPSLPPCDFTGYRCFKCKKSKKVCFNRLKWGTCDSNCVLFYHLYRNGVLIATIPFGGSTHFNDLICHRKRSVTYTLTSVNLFGIESAPVTVTLP